MRKLRLIINRFLGLGGRMDAHPSFTAAARVDASAGTLFERELKPEKRLVIEPKLSMLTRYSVLSD